MVNPRLLAQLENVLVFQSIGGASDYVYVFEFRAGKPSRCSPNRYEASHTTRAVQRWGPCERADDDVARTGRQIPTDRRRGSI